MKKITLVLSGLLMALTLSAQTPRAPHGLSRHMVRLDTRHAAQVPDADADSVIRTPAAGTGHAYYMDSYVYDPNFDKFLAASHQLQQIVLCDNGDVYIPNPLLPEFVNASGTVYLKGRMSADGTKIVVKNGQKVYNLNGEDMRVCAADEEGLAGDTLTKVFSQKDIVFNIHDNGIIVSDEPLMLGLFNASDPGMSYAYLDEPLYMMKDSVDARVSKMRLDLTRTSDDSAVTALVNVDSNGRYRYVQGLVPEYPNAWVEMTGSEQGDSLALTGYQLLEASPYTGNMVFFPTEVVGQFTNPLMYAWADLDPATATISLRQGNGMRVNYYDINGNLQTQASYASMTLTPQHTTLAQPGAPSGFGFHGNGQHVSVMFVLNNNDVNGNPLDTDKAFYRIYINDKPYTFTAAQYTTVKADMELVPWSYDDYDVVSTSGNERYVYFKGLNADDIKTMAVETVYRMDGSEAVSDRLVYDVGTKKSTLITGISNAHATPRGITGIYTLDGCRVPETALKNSSVRGLYIVRCADGKSVKVLRR